MAVARHLETSHRTVGRLFGGHESGQSRAPTVFWTPRRLGVGATAEQRRSLDPDECLVRLRSVRRTLDRNQTKENPDATTPSTAYAYTKDNHGTWNEIFLPLDGRSSNERPL